MNTPVPPTRFALGLAAATTAVVLLAGCDRRPTDVPPPTSGTNSTMPSSTPAPASVITPSSSDAPLAPPGTPGPAAPSEGAPSGGATGK